MKVELRNNSPQLYFFLFQKRNFYIAAIGIVSLLVCCGLAYLGSDVERHPMSTFPNMSQPDYDFAAQRPMWIHKVIANGGRIYRIWGNETYKQIGRLQ